MEVDLYVLAILASDLVLIIFLLNMSPLTGFFVCYLFFIIYEYFVPNGTLIFIKFYCEVW